MIVVPFVLFSFTFYYNRMDTGHYFADIAAIQADKAVGLAAGETALAATDIELVAVSIELVAAAANTDTAVVD